MILKFLTCIISVGGGHYEYSPLAPESLAVPLRVRLSVYQHRRWNFFNPALCSSVFFSAPSCPSRPWQ